MRWVCFSFVVGRGLIWIRWLLQGDWKDWQLWQSGWKNARFFFLVQGVFCMNVAYWLVYCMLVTILIKWLLFTLWQQILCAVMRYPLLVLVNTNTWFPVWLRWTDCWMRALCMCFGFICSFSAFCMAATNVSLFFYPQILFLCVMTESQHRSVLSVICHQKSLQ